MTMPNMPLKAYYIRAIHEWCTDNGYTPYLVVQDGPGVRVPKAFVQDGQITLNVAFDATNKLVLGNDFIEFQARFGGKTESLSVPLGAIAAMFSRETGEGMGFEVEEFVQEEFDEQKATEIETETVQPPKKGSHLKIVK